jgi:hypothetical protein
MYDFEDLDLMRPKTLSHLYLNVLWAEGTSGAAECERHGLVIDEFNASVT